MRGVAWLKRLFECSVHGTRPVLFWITIGQVILLNERLVVLISSLALAEGRVDYVVVKAHTSNEESKANDLLIESKTMSLRMAPELFTKHKLPEASKSSANEAADSHSR